MLGQIGGEGPATLAEARWFSDIMCGEDSLYPKAVPMGYIYPNFLWMHFDTVSRIHSCCQEHNWQSMSFEAIQRLLTLITSHIARVEGDSSEDEHLDVPF
jgi:hypothetical protein